MNVFISWSGDRSKKIASALNNWIPKVIQVARPWMSDEDISTGARWGVELNEILQDTVIGIICVTPENQNSVWLHFEAGALSKSLKDSKVMPLLFEMSPAQLSGPISQFQAVECQKLGVFRIINSINDSLNNSGLKESDLQEIFDVWWPKLEKQLQEVGPHSEVIVKRESSEMLEEILNILREERRESKEKLAKFVASNKDQMQSFTDKMYRMASELENKSKEQANLEKLKLSFLANSGVEGGGSLSSSAALKELFDLIDKHQSNDQLKGLFGLVNDIQGTLLNALEDNEDEDEDEKENVIKPNKAN